MPHLPAMLSTLRRGLAALVIAPALLLAGTPIIAQTQAQLPAQSQAQPQPQPRAQPQPQPRSQPRAQGRRPSAVPVSRAASATSVQPIDRTAWLYTGSDIPRDEAWQFGTLSNGLRYAVRRTGVPPGQISIRLRVDVGALMEEPEQAGWAHLIEHLSFRESRYLTNGEARREWQRLGVSFGSDSNANTSATATTYQLDIPAATSQSFGESMRYLGGMIQSPVLSDATVGAERPIVVAERRERDGVGFRLETASRELYFGGQRLARHSIIGTEATLGAANAAGIQAFHHRWYRPDRTVIAIAGDLDPAELERVIVANFGDWRVDGPSPAEPDFGRPDATLPTARVVVEATQPMLLSLATIRPWQRVTDSIVYTQQLMLDTLAVQVINRRLEERARGGGSYLAAQVGLDKPSRSADITTVTVIPLDNNWRGAMTDVRAIVAEAQANSPTPAEIAREYAEVTTFLAREAANAQNEAGTKQAEDLLRAVDIGETTTSPQHALGLWQSIEPLATPARLLSTTRTLFAGVTQRVLMTTPTPIANGDTELAALISAAPVRTAANDDRRRRQLTFADLPRIGRAGTVTSRTPIERLGMERWELGNGVTAIVRQTNIEPGKVRLRVRFGGGRSGVDPAAPNLLWTGPAALLESGIGRFDQSALDQLVSGRQIGMAFSVDDDAFEIEAETRPEDLHDQLRLIATKLSNPAWQAAPVQRARAGQLLSYDLLSASPMAVIENQLQGIIYSADRRWSPPSRAEIEALTPASFRAFWEPQLRQGPVEILIFGDTQSVDLQAMLRDTFGALPVRQPARTTTASADVRTLTPPADPIRLVHSGEATQAAAVLAYPTGGGLADIRTARQLDVLAAVFNDRLFERLRDQSGASYSQAVSSNWSLAFPHAGYLFVGGLLRPQDDALMFRLGREIAAELATTPVTPDELQRARSPLVEQVLRAASGNVFFMYQLEGASRNPAVITALTSYVGDLSATSPADIQRLAQTYLSPERAIPVLVLPGNAAANTAPVTTASPPAAR